ncbi:MAG TPA: glycerol-3-phosphate dehydrogenase/oxidase [Bryobacterales bacterium]|nr:glycerol-3-phosphate dehydrogenase/oxidase [Bryobacterales bacterium]
MSEVYDLVIIGGGINGTALAALAAENGYRTALVEKNDFGAGVTSRSTRLIHGGLRYLEHGQIGVVRESLREREALLEEFPQQVKPLPFLIPVYQQDSRQRWWIGAGLEAYHWIGHSRLLAKHRRLTAAQTLETEPGLAAEGLRGGFLYFDCQAVYPERLALEMALTAEEHGAEVCNHTPVVRLLHEGGRVSGVQVESGEEFRARLTVSAAGPWADQVRGMLRGLLPVGAPQRPLLTLVSGAHIVTGAFHGAPQHAVYHEASTDRRPFFLIPWRGLWLIGTTETPYQGEPGSPAPSDAELDYLLRESNLLFPEAKLDRGSILYAYAGARPLLHDPSHPAQAITRDHAIYDHEKEEGIGGMLTLAGGKLTTARAFAGEALRMAAARLGKPQPVRRPRPRWEANGVPGRLAEIYGPRASQIIALERERPELARPIAPGGKVTAAEVVHAVSQEKARTLGDILLRRTGLAFEPGVGREAAVEAAREAAPLLGWDEAGQMAAVDAYEQELERTLRRGGAP